MPNQGNRMLTPRIAIAIAMLCFVSAVAVAAVPLAEMQLLTEDRMTKLLDSTATEIPKLITYLLFLGAGWYIGKRLTASWAYSQKQAEQDLTAAADFHGLYGDFFAIWKLWNYFVRRGGTTEFQGGSRWDLLDRASRAEAKLEATLIRLASQKNAPKRRH